MEGISAEGMYEMRHERQERGISHGSTEEQSSEWNSRCKGPEVGTSWAGLWNEKKTCKAEA